MFAYSCDKYYKCEECGEIIREDNLIEVTEKFWENKYGQYAEDTLLGCPHCGKTELHEAGKCEICGEPISEEFGGLCENCIEQYEHNIDECFEIGKNSTETLELNCFLATMFSISEIEKILVDVLKKENASCLKFIQEDEEWFALRAAERLQEKIKKAGE